jgi:DNA-binding MarR family transcriptional regulator
LGRTREYGALAVKDDVKSAFGRIWPTHVASLTRFLIACRKSFDGDLDLFLVLAVIGDRTFSERHADPKLTYEEFKFVGTPGTTAIDINLRSIAAFSGIPRETVRRKIADLESRGWITRNKDGSLTATRKASADLEPLTEAGIEYVAAMLELLKEQFRPAAPRK